MTKTYFGAKLCMSILMDMSSLIIHFFPTQDSQFSEDRKSLWRIPKKVFVLKVKTQLRFTMLTLEISMLNLLTT